MPVIQLPGLALYVVKLTDGLQRTGRQGALVGCVQLKELAPGMSQTADFGATPAEASLVTTVIVTLNCPGKIGGRLV